MHAQRNALALEEGIGPEKAGFAQAARVAAEEGAHRADVRRQDDETLGKEDQHRQRNEAADGGRLVIDEDVAENLPQRAGKEGDPDGQKEPAGDGGGGVFMAGFGHGDGSGN